MGKILDTLCRVQPKTIKPVRHVPLVKPEPAVVVAPGTVEDVLPFIEVGGKDRPAEASADVLAFGPLPTPKPAGESASLRDRAPVPAVPTTPTLRAVVPPALGAGLPSSPNYSFTTGPTLRLLAASVDQPVQKEGSVAAWLIAHHDPYHPVSRQYQDLLRGVRQSVRGKKVHTLLFVPRERNIGATSALLNLAITAAREKTGEVLVVDGNLNDPGIARQLELSYEPGLADVLAGQLNIDKAIRPTRVASLHVLTTGNSELTIEPAAASLATIFRDLSSRFSTIFVDGPCFDESEMVKKFCVACDCVFPVVSKNRADEMLTPEMVKCLAATSCQVAGAILTQN